MRSIIKSMSIILAVCMLFSCAGVTAYADTERKKSDDDDLIVEVIREDTEKENSSEAAAKSETAPVVEEAPAPAAEPASAPAAETAPAATAETAPAPAAETAPVPNQIQQIESSPAEKVASTPGADDNLMEEKATEENSEKSAMSFQLPDTNQGMENSSFVEAGFAVQAPADKAVDDTETELSKGESEAKEDKGSDDGLESEKSVESENGAESEKSVKTGDDSESEESAESGNSLESIRSDESGEKPENEEGNESGDESENEESVDDAEKEEEESESEGDLSTEEEGIYLDGEGNFDVLIAGTLSSEGTPVLISDTVNPENVSITVWKIENPVEAETEDGRKEEHVVLEGKPGEEAGVTENSQKVEAGIQYIIKIEPSREDMIQLDGTEKSHGYDTAREGDTVTMIISVPKGYKLTGAYNGEGEKVPLEKDENGNYYVKVPKGGGVYLSAEITEDDSGKKRNDAKDDYEWSGFSVQYDWSYEQEKPDNGNPEEGIYILFDLNGGILDGSRGPISVKAVVGDTATLLNAPTKAGCRFVCWASSAPDITVSAPGETFVVTHSVTFVAVWEECDSVLSAGNEDGFDETGAYAVDKDDDEDDDEDDEDEDVTETVRVTGKSGEKTEIEIDGSLKVEGNPAAGVEIDGEGEVEVEVDGEITVSGGAQGATGIKATVTGPAELNAEVEAGDGMTVKASGDGDSIGIEASSSGGGTLEFEFEGNIDVSSDSGTSTGVIATATDSGSTANVKVEGNLKSGGIGAELHAEEGSTVTMIIGKEK